MAGSAVIGSLRVNLGIDTAAFDKGLDSARKSLAAAGKQMQAVGKTLSVAVTAPLVAAGVSIVRVAGSFEASMNRLQAATGASSDGFQAMREEAKKLGRTTQFSASEAAGAMETLAKNGLNVEQILGGATSASLALAAATGTDLSNAADIATDVMLQFGKSASDLGPVVDGITGVLLSSKFGIDDYRLALAQAGGVAGALGVEFEDFNAAIAATSSMFASGSDAGTSFKTFLLRLVPNSMAAESAIKDLGLEFFDAQGNMKSMADIAEELKDGLAGLSESQANESLNTIFGTDALRTAIGLSRSGREGILQLQDAIADASAVEQADARMKGWQGTIKQVESAIEALQIAIGDSGLLEFVTDLAARFRDFVVRLSETSPQLLKWGTIVAGVAAIIGPVVLAVGGLALAISAISLPVAAAVAGVAALGFAFVAYGDQIMAAARGIWESVSNAIGPRLVAIADAASAVFVSLRDLLASVFGVDLGDNLGTAAASLRDFLGAIVEASASQLFANFEGVLIGIAGAFNYIADVLDAVKLLLNGDIPGAFEAMKTAGANLKTSIIESFEAMKGGIVAAVSGIAASVIAEFKTLPANLFAAGKDAIQGLIDGIKAKASELKSYVSGLVTSIPDLVRGLWDEHSPSKLFYEIGAFAMQGLQDGMASKQGDVVEIARMTAMQVQSAIDLAGGAKKADPWAEFRTSTDSASESLSAFGQVGQSIGGMVSGAFKSVVDGSKTVGEALRDVLSQLADMFLNQGFQLLFGGLFGGGGQATGSGGLLGGLGGLLGNIFGGLPGFANGAEFDIRGGNNKMDGEMMAMRVSAGEHVSVSRDGENMGGGAMDVRVYVDQDGNWRAAVERIARGQAAQVTQAGIGQYDRMMQGSPLLQRINQAQLKYG